MLRKYLCRKWSVARLGKVVYILLIVIGLLFVINLLRLGSAVKTLPKEARETSVGVIRNKAVNGTKELVVNNDTPVMIKPSVITHPRPSPFPSFTFNRSRTFQVTAGVTGRLGNQMFQYASLLGIAYMNGMEPFYPSDTLGRTFEVSHVQKRPSRDFRVANEKDFAAYDPSFERLPRTNTLIMQYFQSWKYFRFIRPTVTKEFAFKEHIRVNAEKILARYSGRIVNRTLVGIHVRRGDMNLQHHIRKGYHMAPASYLRQAVDYMRHRHPDARFLMMTDDAQWVRNNMDMSDVLLADRASAEVHLCLLSMCRHVIMTVGTFGWWGGYLAGGEVLYYWDPAQMLHDPPLPVEIRHPEDFFLPDWVPLTGL